MHCDNAPCIAAYPEAVYKRSDGIVIIDPMAPMDEGIVASCPYGTIFWNEELQIGQKCTLCVHRLEEGEVPRCIISCPAQALFIGEETALAPLIEKAEPLHPEYGAMPRVHYISLPKRLIAGSVYDVRADECLKDATITVRSLRTGEMWAANTDEFGDFWLEELEPRDLVMVRFEKPGYLPRMRLVYTREDRVLGDLAMWK